MTSPDPKPNQEISPAQGSPAPASGDAVLSEAQAKDRIYEVTSVIDMLRPYIQQDGGDIELLSVDPVTGVLEVQLQGACSSCAISASTLTGAVERIIKERCTWVSLIKGTLDDSLDYEDSMSMGVGAYVPRYTN
jgi:Fe-S cluster biogenesis protein NfuA